MAKTASITTRFDNYSPAMLADLIGKLDREAKAATSELDAAKDAFKARGLLIAEGDTHSVMVQKTIRQTLDPAKVKAELSQLHSLTSLITMNYEGTSENGAFAMSHGLLLEAIGDIEAKGHRIKTAIEGLQDALLHPASAAIAA